MFVVKPMRGLCNRLRALFSCYAATQATNDDMLALWLPDAACPGFFPDYFDSVPRVTFADRYIPCKINYAGSNRYKKFLPDYSALQPRVDILEKVNHRRSVLGDGYLAIHVRRTDHRARLVGYGYQASFVANPDDKFFQAVDETLGDRKLFVATDNAATYDVFYERYGAAMPLEYPPNDTAQLRHTSLEAAVLDIYTCRYAQDFIGSDWSSFSGFIKELRKKAVAQGGEHGDS